MKRITLVLVLLLTGCTNSLVCSNITESDSLYISENIVIKYWNNEIKHIDDKIIYNVKDDILKQGFINVFNDVKSNYDIDSVGYKYYIDGDSYILNVFYSPSKLDDNVLKKIDVSNNLKEYSGLLISRGFHCK